MVYKSLKPLSLFLALICVFGATGCNRQTSEWPPWEISGESSLITTIEIDLPSVVNERSSLGRIFYDLEREQIYLLVGVWEQRKPPNLGNYLRTDYYYVDIDKKVIEKAENKFDVIEMFIRGESMYASDYISKSTINKQPFGNLALTYNVNQTSTSRVLKTNWPPGTGASFDKVGNGTLTLELTGDNPESVFSLSEKYDEGSEGYDVTFTPDGLYAVVWPDLEPHGKKYKDILIIVGELPVNKRKTEIHALVKEEFRKRVEEGLVYDR